MHLKRRSQLVRWAYLCESKDKIPPQTSLCALFWRCVLGTPLFLLAIGVFTGGLLLLVWTFWRGFAVVFGVGLLAAGAIFAGVQFAGWHEQRRRGKPGLGNVITNSVLWQGAIAVKSKFCPLIDLHD